MVAEKIEEIEEIEENSQVDFIGVCPRGEIIVNRRSGGRPPFAYVVVGYHDNGALGVFHWTSRTDKAYLKRVLLNALRKARQHKVELSAKNLHIIEATAVAEVPDKALYLPKGQRHFFPAPTRGETLAALTDRLGNPDITEEKRSYLELRIAKLNAKISATTAAKTDAGLADGEEFDVAALEELEVPTDSGEGFRTKKAAMSTAKDRGLTAENVIRNDDGLWIIVAR